MRQDLYVKVQEFMDLTEKRIMRKEPASPPPKKKPKVKLRRLPRNIFKDTDDTLSMEEFKQALKEYHEDALDWFFDSGDDTDFPPGGVQLVFCDLGIPALRKLKKAQREIFISYNAQELLEYGIAALTDEEIMECWNSNDVDEDFRYGSVMGVFTRSQITALIQKERRAGDLDAFFRSACGMLSASVIQECIHWFITTRNQEEEWDE